MEWAAAEFFGEQGEGEALFNVLLDIAANCADLGRLRISVEGFGTAAEAGAESGLLGLDGGTEKGYVLAPRAFGGTRGAAEDSGAGDGEDECSVVRVVAIENGLPAAGIAVFG